MFVLDFNGLMFCWRHRILCFVLLTLECLVFVVGQGSSVFFLFALGGLASFFVRFSFVCE